MEVSRRTSKKRQAILDAILSSPDHPSAEMVYARLKNDYPDLSLGTVYRNIGVLMEEGVLFRVGNVQGEDRFDANVFPHAHFICQHCDRVSDIKPDVVPVPDAAAAVERALGVRVNERMLTYLGICPDCMNKES